MYNCKYGVYVFGPFSFAPSTSVPCLSWGQTGCKNERPGGETVKGGDGPFFVYFVYRSFKEIPKSKGEIPQSVRSYATC